MTENKTYPEHALKEHSEGEWLCRQSLRREGWGGAVTGTLELLLLGAVWSRTCDVCFMSRFGSEMSSDGSVLAVCWWYLGVQSSCLSP